MAEPKKSLARQFGMAVRGGLQSGDVHAHYQNMVILVDHVIDDPSYGPGVVGRNLYTGRDVVVFSNPVVSESKAKFPNAKFMRDWVRGLNFGGGKKYTVGPGAIIFVNEIMIKSNARTRVVDIHGESVTAPVYFVQWINCWRSMEAAQSGGNDKDILIGYGIGSINNFKTRDDKEVSSVNFHFFQPQGPDNRFNRPGYDYPVVFSAHSLDELLSTIERECADKMFTHIMTRVIDDETGKIVGQGREINMYNKDVGVPYAETFATKLAYALNLTRSGLERFVSLDGYTFQFFGLHSWTCSYAGDESAEAAGRRSFVTEVMENKSFFPRDENGNIFASVATPVGLRTTVDTNGRAWIKPIKMIGFSGMKTEKNGETVFSEESEIIAADSYSGKPIFDATGKQVERGLERDDIPFNMTDDQSQAEPVYADSMFSLGNIMCCKQVNYPDGTQRSYDAFLEIWDDTGQPFPYYGAQQPQPAQPAPAQPQPAPAPQRAAQPQPQPATPPTATQPAPAQPAAQPRPAPAQPQPAQPTPRRVPQRAQPQAAPAQPQPAATQPAPQPDSTPDYPPVFGSESGSGYMDEVPF